MSTGREPAAGAPAGREPTAGAPAGVEPAAPASAGLDPAAPASAGLDPAAPASAGLDPVAPAPAPAPGAPAPPVPPRLRRGVGYWWHGYATMMRFDLANQRLFLPVFAVIQLAMGAGMAFMYGYFLGDLPQRAATYVTTGIPALALVPLGFVAVPAVVGELRMTGAYDFVLSLPVPRLAAAAATFTVYTVLALPGTVVALLVACARYGVSVDVHPSAVVALTLSSLMSASVGFGMAHAISDPRVTNLIANILIFFVLLFSPIVVPLDRFPGWLAAAHQWLPFHHMAVVIRAGLTDGLVTGVTRSYLVLAAWTVGSWALAALAIARRR